MSKSVLVIGAPENRYSCYLRKLIRVKPDWCPLVDLPKKDNGDYPANTSDASFVEGWNQCIDEITGGEVDDKN